MLRIGGEKKKNELKKNSRFPPPIYNQKNSKEKDRKKISRLQTFQEVKCF